MFQYCLDQVKSLGMLQDGNLKFLLRRLFQTFWLIGDKGCDRMKASIRTKDYEKVSRDYDNAYKTGSPFRNPEWFINSIKKIIEKEKKDGKVLDIACGDGHFISHLTNYQRYGVDISKEAIRKANNLNIGKFVVSEAENLPFKDIEFDFITCMGSLEHFIDMDASLKEMKRVLKKNGIAIIHVPNSIYLVNTVLGVDTHHQINERFATEKEWISIISPYFKVEKTIKYNTRWFLKWLPKKYSCHFTFVCRNI